MEAPAVDASAVAKSAIERYDKDGDGRIAGDELSPGLRALVKTADENSDDALSEAEIAERLQVHVESQVGLQDVGGLILLDGRPLTGATVRFIPDPVLEGAVDPARGETDESGFVALAIEGNDLPGVKPGFYRVEVSKQRGDGRELLPARYNRNSELGEEVGPNVSQGGWQLELRSR